MGRARESEIQTEGLEVRPRSSHVPSVNFFLGSPVLSEELVVTVPP